jgi:hypothetical protein
MQNKILLACWVLLIFTGFNIAQDNDTFYAVGQTSLLLNI